MDALSLHAITANVCRSHGDSDTRVYVAYDINPANDFYLFRFTFPEMYNVLPRFARKVG